MKALRYLRQLCLTKEWRAFLELSPKQQLLEKAVVFAAQWCQPNVDVSWKDIEANLDKLAEEAKEHLRRINSNHPLFHVSAEQLKTWRDENIDCSSEEYLNVHCTQIVTAVTNVLQDELRGKSLMNWILDKTGCGTRRPADIIMFNSVARRLGIKEYKRITYPLNFPILFSDEVNAQTVVAYVAQNIVSYRRNNTGSFNRISSDTRWRSLSELVHLVIPSNLRLKNLLAQIYIRHKMDTKSYIESLMHQRNQASEYVDRIVNMLTKYEAARNCDKPFVKVQKAIRPQNLKYAVGMVMKFVSQNNHYTCVICDWDSACFASNERPTYSVLSEDGSYRTVLQENLKPSVVTADLHLVEDIGRHFSHVFETHFVPNAAKKREYPADEGVRDMFRLKAKLDCLKL